MARDDFVRGGAATADSMKEAIGFKVWVENGNGLGLRELREAGAGAGFRLSCSESLEDACPRQRRAFLLLRCVHAREIQVEHLVLQWREPHPAGPTLVPPKCRANSAWPRQKLAPVVRKNFSNSP